MVSDDVSSLFTNVLIEETIDIICEHADNTKIPLAVLKELLLMCTKNKCYIWWYCLSSNWWCDYG